MKSTSCNNESPIGVDISGEERRAFLQKLQRTPQFNKKVRHGVRAECLIGTDVSIADRRSVKAQLAGRTAWRVLWWDLNCWVCNLTKPRISHEESMFAFHKCHHRITLTWVGLTSEAKQLYYSIDQHGARAGVRLLIEQERAAQRGDDI